MEHHNLTSADLRLLLDDVRSRLTAVEAQPAFFGRGLRNSLRAWPLSRPEDRPRHHEATGLLTILGASRSL